MNRRLHDESGAFELDRYDLSLRIGHATFLLSAYHGDRRGILVAEDLDANREAFKDLYLPIDSDKVETVNEIAPVGALIHLGESVRIGRAKGIEVIDRRGQTDEDRHHLYDWGPVEEAIRIDTSVSRRHVLISALGVALVEVTDLNSLNGTFVETREPETTA